MKVLRIITLAVMLFSVPLLLMGITTMTIKGTEYRSPLFDSIANVWILSLIALGFVWLFIGRKQIIGPLRDFINGKF